MFTFARHANQLKTKLNKLEDHKQISPETAETAIMPCTAVSSQNMALLKPFVQRRMEKILQESNQADFS